MKFTDFGLSVALPDDTAHSDNLPVFKNAGKYTAVAFSLSDKCLDVRKKMQLLDKPLRIVPNRSHIKLFRRGRFSSRKTLTSTIVNTPSWQNFSGLRHKFRLLSANPAVPPVHQSDACRLFCRNRCAACRQRCRLSRAFRVQ